MKQYIILNTSRKHVNYEEEKNKVPMNKPYNIQKTNNCNGIFHISFFKALLIYEGETTRGPWGSSSLNQCLTHNKCSWCLSCNLSPSLRTFLVPLVRASFLSDKCGNVLQYHSWAFSSKTTQGNLSIHEFWNIVVRFSLSYLRSLFLGVSRLVGSSFAFRFSAFLTKIKIKQRHFTQKLST